jgi:hypothetical protein
MVAVALPLALPHIEFTLLLFTDGPEILLTFTDAVVTHAPQITVTL